ncbi:AmpG family muropeptide MFS transporter [Allohahella sp. A8]|uniref:AmpG family muropeptide MFS transporter n=1 Tax=Allohahella sp. A8 TaxID=3141461 RepID=UPI003A807300
MPQEQSWWAALSVYASKPVLVLFALGVSAGLPFLLVFSTLTAWLTEAGLTNTTIGFISWVGITYSIKIIWAPLVDRIRIPVLHRWVGPRRSFIMLAQLGIGGGLLAMSVLNPATEFELLAFFAVVVAFSSATQDIAIDAYRIELAEDNMQAAMSAAYVFGYRVALLIGGAGALYIAEFFSWQIAYQSMAALAFLLLGVTLIADQATVHRPSTTLAPGSGAVAWLTHTVVDPFADFLRRYRYQALLILALVGCYRISDIIMGAMANPFYLQLGFSKTDIANVTKVFGFGMTILGSFLGGLLVTRYGVAPILCIGAICVSGTNLLFSWLSTVPPDLLSLGIVISADNLSGGLAIVAFIAFLSSLTSSEYTATQYALFSSIMTLPGKFFSGYSGLMVDSWGFGNFFLLAAALGVPAIGLSFYWLWTQRAQDGVRNVANET